MRTRTRLIRRTAAAIAVGLVAAGLLTSAPSAATASPALSSGADWTVTSVSGGYQVALSLDDPVPVVDDAPTLVVDGHDYGVATESADGLTLSIVTSDPTVAEADSVEMGWASGAESHTPATDSPVTSKVPAALRKMSAKAARRTAASDGSDPGTYSYTEDDYDFGDQAIALAGIGGIRGEMEGRVYLPTTGGARPTVILLHGRHSSCSSGSTWPCAAGRFPILSYKGYDALGQLLATHGYSVVSISADAINANDNQLAPDDGAKARGQLVLDSLEMLRKANAGEPVSYHDAALNQDLTLDQAFASTLPDATGPIATGTLTAADLVGRFDLSNVGLMGHSRGGEGVVSAVTLNQMLAHPFGIKSVLPLAPVDFGRMTVTDTPMLVILPYCDGDVSNQQGQHFSDDSRYAFDDDVLRSTVWVMGADHNFFNTVWTPGDYPYGTADDWSPTGSSTRNDTVCSTSMAGNQRLSSATQSQTGAILMSDWFRLTLGDEDQFLPMFDGTVKPTLDSLPSVDLRAVATAPAGDRADIAQFVSDSQSVTALGSSTIGVCASAGGRTLPQTAPACATAGTVRSTSAMPHWTPASFAPNVPASPMERFLWTSTTGSTAGKMTVRVPASARNASAYQTLSFKTAPDEAVVSGTDLTLTVVDGAGATWSTPVSAINPLAVNRLPISGSTTLNKIVLQQVSIPVSSITGIDTTDIREIRFAGAVGADATSTGGAYLSDLAWSNSAVGTPVVAGSMATIGVAPTTVEEGDTADTHTMAVVLSKPVTTPVTGYYTLIGSTSSTSKAGLAMQAVTFAPGETCKTVTVPTFGDSTAGTTASTAYKADISNPQGIITGDNAYANLTIREDDGVTGSAVELPAVGVQGDACAEYAAQSQTFGLATTNANPHSGDPLVLTGSGYRPGETVTLSLDGSTVTSALAAGDGTVSFSTTAPAALGQHRFAAVGAGSLRTSTFEPYLRQATTAVLTVSPTTPQIKKAVTLTASFSGAPDGADATFFDGTSVIGTATVLGGAATLEVPAGFTAAAHALTVSLPETSSSDGAVSGVIAFTLAKGASTTMLTLSSPTSTYGAGASGEVTVEGADGGTVTVAYDGTSVDLPLDAAGTASFELPAGLAVGDHTVTAAYSGSDTVDAGSPASATYTVTRAASSVAVKAKGSLKQGKKLPVAVTVTGAPGVAAPSGTVKVTFAGVTKTVTLAHGTASTTFTATKKGLRSLTVSYAGDASYLGGTATKAVTVTKAKKKH